MSFSFSPDLDQWVQQKLATGKYLSEEEVLRAAFNALDSREETLAAIQEGYADFQAGRYQSLKKSDAEFRQERGLPQD